MTDKDTPIYDGPPIDWGLVNAVRDNVPNSGNFPKQETSCCDGGRCVAPVYGPASKPYVPMAEQCEQIQSRVREAVQSSAISGQVAKRIESDTKPDRGHPEFRRILDDVWRMHCRKGSDYGTDVDVFQNIRQSEEFGIPGWLGAVLRANDKVSRLKAYAQKGTLANEGVEDSLMDLAAYAIIALVLHREAEAAPVAVSDR